MKFKIIFTVMLITLTNNALAMQIEGGRILSSKTWTKGNVSGHFEDGNEKNSNRAHVTSSIQDVSAYQKEIFMVPGHHWVNILNQTSEKQIYAVTYQVCVESKDERCIYRLDNIELKPNGYFENVCSSYLNTNFEDLGIYKTSGLTMVEGESFSKNKAIGKVEIKKYPYPPN